MQNVPKRSNGRNRRRLLCVAEAAEDQADLVRIIVADLRALLDPLDSRVLEKCLGKLERQAAGLDGLAVKLTTIAEENGINGR